MAAACSGAHHGTSGFPPMPPPYAGATLPGVMGGGCGAHNGLPPVDPNFQAYTAMFTQYLQQAHMAQAAQAYGAPAAPPMPFPSAAYDMSAMQPQSVAVISVSVEGMKFQYQLTEDDLHKVFSRYGSVQKIKVDEAGTSASITFQDMQQAQAAMTDLNGKVLNGLEGTLRLNWAPTESTPPYNPYWHMPPATPGFPAGNPLLPNAAGPGDISTMLAMTGAATPGALVHGAPMAPMPAAPGYCGAAAGHVMDSFAGDPGATGDIARPDDRANAPAHIKGVKKYTCRFLIGIENDKDFQVVRRIIGAKGANMKKIVKQTEAKLRLRGQGSGYFEGAGQKESSEPLQLCVSCTSSEGYRTAVMLVEELLKGVYDEYRQFCRDTNKPELDLQPTPQLVWTGGRGAGGAGKARGDLDDDEDDPDGDLEGDSPGRQRRRGRRVRASRPEIASMPGLQIEKGEPPPKAPGVEEIENMIDARNEARRQCNFAEADRLRQELNERGVALMDEPGARGKGAEVTTWRYWRE
eukprot:TRINITY_DN75658_c0_g1_i1.p1 TRINITY_DN75658_c0_g1~~TRINITY_DN75658_c0_g1_i1.p1  ORF type:complete len:586 (+),score=101.17 TRINITY_DN75658_c0_g1_i1:196-1758(+)